MSTDKEIFKGNSEDNRTTNRFVFIVEFSHVKLKKGNNEDNRPIKKYSKGTVRIIEPLIALSSLLSFHLLG